MDPLSRFADAHPLLMAVGGYLVTAAVGTMPPRGTRWSAGVAYDWFFDWAHVVLNQRVQRPSLSAETPAQPKN